jgi:hypothetical protein
MCVCAPEAWKIVNVLPTTCAQFNYSHRDIENAQRADGRMDEPYHFFPSPFHFDIPIAEGGGRIVRHDDDARKSIVCALTMYFYIKHVTFYRVYIYV